MAVETVPIKSNFPAFAVDAEKNVLGALSKAGNFGLSQAQIDGIALTAAYATRIGAAIRWVQARSTSLSPQQVDAARAAASIMALANTYYRFTEQAGNAEISALPPRLRMTALDNPGINRIDFELFLLSASIINDCAYCVSTHVRKLIERGVSNEAVHSVARIASVVNSVAQVKLIENAR